MTNDGDGGPIGPQHTAERWPLRSDASAPGVDETIPTEELVAMVGADEEDLSGREFAGRYRLTRKIGEGAMGHVYLAEHTTIRKMVAVKVLSPAYRGRKDVVTRFLHEAQAASAIRHENVVDITDFGQTDAGSVFFVMEYLEGQPLSAAARRGGPMPWPRVKAIMLQILDALEAAHELGIVHRDMKADNCFLVPRSSGREVVKVLDFGIAKINTEGSESDLTRTGVIMGTANYMSPEQAHGDPVDHRSDLYSCGVIMFELLAGRLPFVGNNPMSIMYKHLHTAPPRPSDVAEEVRVPLAVERIVARALEKKRDERFQSAAEFMAALRAVPDDAVPAAGGAAKGARAWMLATIGIVLVAAVAVGAGLAMRGDGAGAESGALQASSERAGDGVRADAQRNVESAVHPAAASPAAPGAGVEPDGAEDGAASPEAAKAADLADDLAGASAESPSTGGDGGQGEPEEKGPEAAVVKPSGSKSAGAGKRSANAVRKLVARRADKAAVACLEREGAFPGEKVRVSFTVGSDGAVTKAKARGKHAGTPMGRCVESAVKQVDFGPASAEASFEHTFSL